MWRLVQAALFEDPNIILAIIKHLVIISLRLKCTTALNNIIFTCRKFNWRITDGDKGDVGPPGEKGYKGTKGEAVSENSFTIVCPK